MKNLLIIQNYNANKGDSSVVHTMKEALYAMDSAINISLTSYDPVSAVEEYQLNSVEWLISYKKIKLESSKIKKILSFLQEFVWLFYSLIWLFFYKIDVLLPLPKRKEKTIQAYLDSQVVVLPGGHFFTSLNSFPVVFSHAYGLLFAQWLGKKTMIYAQTIGPFFGKLGCLAEKISKIVIVHADIVTIREENSLKFCDGLKNVQVTAEIVFLQPTNEDLAKRIALLDKLKDEERALVGVTIHHIYYKFFFSEEEYVNLMSRIFDNIIDNYDANIVIIPMEASYHHGGDRTIAKAMQRACKNKRRIYLLESDLAPLVISSAIANTDIFIGTKTHSIVYGLKALVPTISISYQQKSTEFMKMFGVEENAINLRMLNRKEFMAVFDRVYSDVDHYKNVEERLYESVKEKALQNNKLLLEMFE